MVNTSNRHVRLGLFFVCLLFLCLIPLFLSTFPAEQQQKRSRDESPAEWLYPLDELEQQFMFDINDVGETEEEAGQEDKEAITKQEARSGGEKEQEDHHRDKEVKEEAKEEAKEEKQNERKDEDSSSTHSSSTAMTSSLSTQSTPSTMAGPKPIIQYGMGLVAWLGRHMLKMPPCPVECTFQEEEFSLLPWMPKVQEGQDPKAGEKNIEKEEMEGDPNKPSAIVFHAPNFGFHWPMEKPVGQLWGVFSLEPECLYPSLNSLSKDPHIDFEMSYRLRAEIWAPYVSGKQTTLDRLRKPLDYSLKNASAPVAAFISNCGATNKRLEYLIELMKHIPVHSYGACLRNREDPRNGEKNHLNKLAILGSYKFYLAFENCNIADYVSEKIFDGFYANTIPVYMGAPNVRRFLPAAHSAILVSDFESPKALAEYLHYVDQNPEVYQSYFAWKTQPYQPSFLKLLNVTKLDSRCRLCMWMHTFPPFCRHLNATQLIEYDPTHTSPRKGCQ